VNEVLTGGESMFFWVAILFSRLASGDWWRGPDEKRSDISVPNGRI
jgi:hypothetical protein